MSTTALDLMERLFVDHYVDVTLQEDVEDTQLQYKSLQNHLQKYDSTTKPKRVNALTDSAQHCSFTIELALFESTGLRTPRLERLYKTMLALPPTSIEAERVFSLTGLFLNKLRNRLKNSTINELCFLKSYFLTYGN